MHVTRRNFREDVVNGGQFMPEMTIIPVPNREIITGVLLSK